MVLPNFPGVRGRDDGRLSSGDVGEQVDVSDVPAFQHLLTESEESRYFAQTAPDGSVRVSKFKVLDHQNAEFSGSTALRTQHGLVGGGESMPVLINRAWMTPQLGAQALPQEPLAESVPIDEPITRLPRHPLNPELSTSADNTAYNRLKIMADQQQRGEGQESSIFNGYKLQSPDLREAIANFRRIDGVSTDPDHPLTPDPYFRERFQVCRQDADQPGLIPGEPVVGGHADVVPPELPLRSARTAGHSHPPGSRPYMSWEPSLRDQKVARDNPHAQFFVKVPDVRGKEGMDILVFNGAFPPRHYVALENPHDVPVPQGSPDIPPSPGGTPGYPPFKGVPNEYQGPSASLPGPPGYDLRLPVPDEQ